MAEGFEISQGEFYVEPGYKLTILKPDSTGVIVFTTDGKDPRSVGGNIVTTANVNEVMAEITISTTSVVKARILDGDNWSALNTIAFSVSENLSNIKITEIHYHPIDFGVISGSELEFIELKNIGSTSLNLSLAKFSEGIDYTFPVPTYLDAGEFIVLASNKRQFNNRYKMEAFGEYTGQLDNAGERITLLNAAEDTIFTLRYNDKSPWPTAADTLGYSLVSVDTNPTSDPGSPTYWRASYSVNGSPGSDDFETMVGQNNIILKSRFALYQNFPNPFNPETTIRFFLPKDAKVTLKIFDVLGQEVQTLIDQRLTQGDHRINWHAKNIAGGIYFYRLEADGLYSEIKKLVYLK